ncbi:hypothetical protein Q31a_21630 [Aureliella helgolandensis]|uniref:Uncharacterized protein n=2 Tax=Aureliella helgolandensis TaxID=2527968 RepID=A0A518G5I8_9BACT|nr:hypothetical protein Q31a_21630 [Aureliella helgolandensis]
MNEGHLQVAKARRLVRLVAWRLRLMTWSCATFGTRLPVQTDFMIAFILAIVRSASDRSTKTKDRIDAPLSQFFVQLVHVAVIAPRNTADCLPFSVVRANPCVARLAFSNPRFCAGRRIKGHHVAVSAKRAPMQWIIPELVIHICTSISNGIIGRVPQVVVDVSHRRSALDHLGSTLNRMTVAKTETQRLIFIRKYTTPQLRLIAWFASECQ